MSKNKPPDSIWLQWHEDGDMVNRSDPEYLLATPERKAAPDGLKVSQILVAIFDRLLWQKCPLCEGIIIDDVGYEHDPRCLVVLAIAHIAKATGADDAR